MLVRTMTLRLASYVALSLLALGVAGYAFVAYSVMPLGALVHPDMRAAFEAHRIAVYSHVFGAAFALLLGPFQFSTRLRRARPEIHRCVGRLYLLLGVVIGGVSGLYLAAYAYGGAAGRIGFGVLAVAWLYTGLRAYLAVRARKYPEHRAWMVRNFALAFAAVTLRIYLGLAVAVGWSFEVAYPVIAWLCWVPNLLLAETLVRKYSQPLRSEARA